MEAWQTTSMKQKLRFLLDRKPFFAGLGVKQVPLHFYSAGRRHIGNAEQPWRQALRSDTRVFRADVQHDGHVDVTCLQSEARSYSENGQPHHISGLHPEMQEEVVRHPMFTACLLLLHDRLQRATEEVMGAGKEEINFVVSCNAGNQRSVAMVSIMRAVLEKDGWPRVTADHLHLWGCKDPFVAVKCCHCRACWYPGGVPAHVVQSAFQQWRAVCC